MVGLNKAFEELKATIPIFPYEKKLSRIQTLRLAIDYIQFMGNILQPEMTHVSQNQENNFNTSSGHSPDSSVHLSPDSVPMYWN